MWKEFLNASFQIENNKLEGNEKGSMHASLEKIACSKKNIKKCIILGILTS